MLGSLVRKMEPNIGKAFFAACLKNSLLVFNPLFFIDAFLKCFEGSVRF